MSSLEFREAIPGDEALVLPMMRALAEQDPEVIPFPAHRRRGFGRQAMAFVEQEARKIGVNAIHLEVDPGNDSARELYRRTGYVDHKRFLMTKWLKRDTK